MYGFKKPKFEFPIKRAQIDFWSIGFRRCVRGPAEINPQLPRNIVVGGLDNRVWAYVWVFLKPCSILVQSYFKIQDPDINNIGSRFYRIQIWISDKTGAHWLLADRISQVCPRSDRPGLTPNHFVICCDLKSKVLHICFGFFEALQFFRTIHHLYTSIHRCEYIGIKKHLLL